MSRYSRTVLRVFVVVSSFLGQAWGISGKGCLSYEPTEVKLSGTIISKTFPGPPNYESIKGGDEPETYWMLVLPHPVCVDQTDPAELINVPKHNIRRIQLAFRDEKDDRTYRSLLGRRVMATGTLYGSYTGHHRTPVLLMVHTLAKAK